jgi:hypothetical protein
LIDLNDINHLVTPVQQVGWVPGEVRFRPFPNTPLRTGRDTFASSGSLVISSD